VVAPFASVQTISAPASTGTQQYSCPVGTKALLFLGIGDIATADGRFDEWAMMIGAATGTGANNQWGYGVSSDDGANPSDNVTGSSNAKCIYFPKYNAGSGVVTLAAALTDLDAVNGDFTLDWTATVSGVKIRVMAIGGDAVSARAHTFSRRTSVGTLGITDPGFTPTGVFFVPTRINADEGLSANLWVNLGATGVIGDHWAISNSSTDNVASSDTGARQITTKTGAATTAGGASVSYEFSLDSYDTNGFTTNFSTAGGVAERVHCLSLAGINVDVGFITQPVAGGAQNQNSPALGFTPVGVVFASWNFAASSSISQTANRLSVGFGDGTNRAAVLSSETSAQAGCNAQCWSDDTHYLYLGNENSSFSDASIDTVTFNPDTFTVHWDDLDTTPRQVVYFAFGPSTTTQTFRPASDVADGTWTDQAGGTSLFAAIDEDPADDSDYIQSSLTGGTDTEAKVRVAVGTDPQGNVNHVVNYRYRKNLAGGDTVNYRVRLYDSDGTTVIASNQHNDVSENWTNGSFTLTGGEADAITGYASGLVLGFLRN